MATRWVRSLAKAEPRPLPSSPESENCECGRRSMGRAFSPTMHYVYADRWTAALMPRAFNGPLLDNLQWDDTTWSQCLIRHRRDARPATPLPIWPSY